MANTNINTHTHKQIFIYMDKKREPKAETSTKIVHKKTLHNMTSNTIREDNTFIQAQT